MNSLSKLMAGVVIGIGALTACVGDTEEVIESASYAAYEDCTHTQGYWKNHPYAWPVSSLSLGGVSYDKYQLLSIFKRPVKGNGLVSLAHQLIAAKLNVEDGAAYVHAIGYADALIGNLIVPPVGYGHLAPSVTSALVDKLTEFNESTGDNCVKPPECGNGYLEYGEECDDGNTYNGDGCSAYCELEPTCGDGTLDYGEECDDGNTYNDDGCSAYCTLEPRCGDGELDYGEECDDGNTYNDDGCSAYCTLEPTCGDGTLDYGEECDDGNTTNGDGCSAYCVCEPAPPVYD